MAEAIDKANDGDTVTLLCDVTLSEAIMINKSITIDGGTGSKTIDFSSTSVLTSGICVVASNATVTLKNLNVKSTSGTMERALQVDNDCTNVDLVVENCDLSSSYYAINLTSGSTGTLTASHSTITGWAAFNCWSDHYEATFEQCTLNGVNDKSFNGDGWNDFGTVVLEGDTTMATAEGASSCQVVLKNCTITATQSTGNTQHALLFNTQSGGNTVSMEACTITLGEGCDFLVDNGGFMSVDNQTILDKATLDGLNLDGTGLEAVQQNDGTYRIVDTNANAWYYWDSSNQEVEYEGVKASLKDVLTSSNGNALTDGEYIDLFANVTLPGDLNVVMSGGLGTFTLNLGGYTITGGKICLPDGCTVICDTQVDDLFEGAVTRIGSTYYTGLAAAIAAAENGDTVTLLQDTQEKVTVESGQAITLDLNGKKLITNISVSGSLTVQDSSEGAKGVIINSSESGLNSHTVNVKNGGSLTLKSGTIDTVVTNKSAIYVSGNGWFDMKDGNVISSNGGTNYQDAALYLTANAHATISGGVISNRTRQNSEDYYAMRAAANSYCTITGGRFEGYVYFGAPASRHSITGGTYTMALRDDDKTKITSGYVLVEIDGGYQIVEGSLTEDNAYVKLTMGGIDTYYYTVADAMNALNDNTSGTITLLKKATASPTIPSGKTITLDLNGQEMLGHIDVESGAKLIVQDSTALTEPILNDDYSVSYPAGRLYTTNAYVIKAEGKVEIISGIVESRGSLGDDFGAPAAVLAYNGGSVCINGGYVTGAQFGAKPYGGTSSITINGGIVEGQDNAAVGTYGSDTGATKITVNSGTVVGHIKSDGAIACGIYQPSQNGAVNINGGTVIADGGVGVLVRAGTLNINGGTVIGSGTTEGTVGDSEKMISPSGVVLDLESGYAEESSVTSVTIDGDNTEIRAGSGIAAVAGTDSPSVTAASQITILKGNFSSAVDKGYLDDSLTVELYSTSKNANAPYSYYSAVKDAQEDAQSGDIVIDLSGVKEASKKYNVIIDYGNGVTATMSEPAGVVITLPSPVRPGYIFLGWRDSTGTHKAGAAVTITADTTFTAVWDGIQTVIAYPVTVPSDIENGTVTVSPSRAVAGQAVTITVTPDAGYAMDTLTVTDASGNAVTVTKVSDTQYTFTMPAGKVTVSVSFVCDGKAPNCPSAAYTDLNTGAWYHLATDYVIENGLMDGIGGGLFNPDGTLTRAMVVTILYRLEDKPDISDKNLGYPYADVNADSWYADAVYWARLNDIANGYSDEKFGPNDPITREQLATMLYRYAQYKGCDVTASADLTGYTDADHISAYAQAAMSWANAEGIVDGTSPTTLDPKGTATRAQAAAMLMRFCENIMK